MNGPQGVARVRDYGCAKVRRLLDSYLAGELSVETNHEVLDHFSRCAPCEAESAAREALRAAVRRAAARMGEDPAEELEARVRLLVAATPAPRRAGAGALLVAAAVLLGAAGLGVLSWRGLFPRERGASVAAVDDGALGAAAGTQEKCTLAHDWRAKGKTLAEVENDLGRPASAALAPIAAKLPGYSVLAAHDCGHGGRRVTHVILGKDGEAGRTAFVSAIVMPRRGALPPAEITVEDVLRLGQGASRTISAARRGDLEIAAVELADSTVFVVSSRPRSENLELSRAILPALILAIAR